MNENEVRHLATLARLDLTDAEIAAYTKDIQGILTLVDKFRDVEVSADGVVESAHVRNVFRDDEPVLEAGTYTDVLVAEMPESHNGYNKVKKIL